MDDFLDRETGIEAELAKDQPRRPESYIKIVIRTPGKAPPSLRATQSRISKNRVIQHRPLPVS